LKTQRKKSTGSALFEAARRARARAYAPYSGFKVGAAILADNGRIYVGGNVENAAYPEGICAETAAIAAMIQDGGAAVAAIAVVGAGQALVTPCGGCRQRIREFARPATPIHVCGLRGLRKRFTLKQLLPESFGPDNLKTRKTRRK